MRPQARIGSRPSKGVLSGFALVSAVLLGALAAGASGQTGKQQTLRPGGNHVAIADPAARFVPGELLVQFRPNVGPAERAAALREQSATFVRDTLVPGLVLARLAPGQGVNAAAGAFSRRSDVVFAEPNWIFRASATPNDPRFLNGELWGLHNTGQSGGAADADIDAPEAWDTTTGSSDVVVAVVDTGVAYDHPDLSSNIWANPGEIPGNGIDDDGNGRIDDHRGWDFIGNDNDPRDLNGHGTHVAGTVGAQGNNATGVVGVNWDVSLMPVRVLNAGGSGTNESVTNGFAYAVQEGARIVNASLGGGGAQPLAMKAVIDAAAATTLFVVAAGNDSSNNDAVPQWPCNFTSANLICVASTTRTDGLSSFSNVGATSVDLGAPGSQIVSAWLAFDTKFTDGFETATGWVAGVETAPPPFTNCVAPSPANTWARTTEAAAAGSWSATDSPGGSYPTCSNNWFRAPTTFNFTGSSGCHVAYDLRLQTEDFFDWFVVDASTNGVSWQEIGAWNGNSGGAFFPLTDDLSGYDGQPVVHLRFGQESDEVNIPPINYDGSHVDNVAIRCAGTTYDASSYNSISGTSMATPHVAGVAALAWAKNPAASVPNVRTAILNGGDPKPALSGNTVTGRRLNANGTLALIDEAHTFADVPPSNPHFDDIEQLYALGITTGCGTNGAGQLIFCPGDFVPRQQMAAFIIRALGLPQLTPATPTFADVPTTNPFFGYIERLYEQEITTGCQIGPPLLYCPGDFVPRQQMAAFLIRAKGLTQLFPATPTFADVPTTNPFFGYIERLFEQGITTGCQAGPPRLYCPADFVQRQQMASFLIRAFAP